MLVIFFLRIVVLYLIIGFVFALFFVWRGAKYLDEAAKDAAWTTKILWIPGSILLWPLIANKWRKINRVQNK